MTHPLDRCCESCGCTALWHRYSVGTTMRARCQKCDRCTGYVDPIDDGQGQAPLPDATAVLASVEAMLAEAR